MGWFTRSRHRKPAAERKGGLWTQCPSCSAHVFKEEWGKSNRVCPTCNYHDRLTCHERLKILTDDGSFEQFFDEVTSADPLNFVDAKGSYAAKTEAVKQKTGLSEAVITGQAAINGINVVLAVMDFRFVGGSLSSGTGEKILRASEMALKGRLPFIIISASGGARMQEGTISLMQMAKTCAGISRLHRNKTPYISVITDPTFGGVSASYAMVGDVNIAEPGALVGFAGRRVIEQTIKQKLPPDFQTAEYLLEHGFLDMIVNRSEMKNTLSQIMSYWQQT
jgi:acetyl-CoA carboxylase carboxyl transferase subunit beta